MAKFDPYQFLQRGMTQFAPSGGWGIPNLGALQELLKQQAAYGARASTASDLESLRKMGMGRSVAGAFSGGTRREQYNQSLMEALAQLQAQHGQMGTSQRMQLLQSLMPAMQVGYQQSQQPSFLSSLLGGIFGTGLEMATPWLGGKLFGNAGLDMLQELLGGQNTYR